MSNKLKKLLVLLLIILKETTGPNVARCSCITSPCVCRNMGLTSVPQNLHGTYIFSLDLKGNKITAINSFSDFAKLGKLTKLYLDSNLLSNIQRNSFFNLARLKELKLSSNRIANIQPGSFSNLRQLQLLQLQSNNLTNIQPGSFAGLLQLKTLWLHSNKIANIHPGSFAGLLKLQMLYLSSNKIANIQPGSFSNLPQLRDLRLNSNKIANIQTGSFSHLQKLQVLQLQSNNLTNIHPGSFAGLPQLQMLYLYSNKIANIQLGSFSNLPLLQKLWLNSNKLINIPPGEFSNLPLLKELKLDRNNLSYIHPGMFSSLPNLKRLSLAFNCITTIQPDTVPNQVSSVTVNNNPWQCDCRMVPFRLKMTASFDIICSKPVNFLGRRLKGIDPKDLICESPDITKFERIDNKTMVQGKRLHLVCEASGIPAPGITVTLPSGRNTTVQSGGRVTVELNDTVTDITAGLYTCIAASPVGSTFATLSVDALLNMPTTTTVMSPATSPLSTTGTSLKMESNTYPKSAHTVSQLNVHVPTNSPLSSTGTSFKMESNSYPESAQTVSPQLNAPTTAATIMAPANSPLSTTGTSHKMESNSYPESAHTVPPPVLIGSLPPEEPVSESNQKPSLSVLIGYTAAAVASIVLIGTCSIPLAVCWKRWARNRSIGPDPGVMLNNTSTTEATDTVTHGQNQIHHHDTDA